MEMLLQDIRYGLRTFQKNPGFTAIAVLTLALGIGANTSIFSVVNGVLLRPLPYREPGQLVRVVKEAPPDGGMVLGGGEFIGGPEFVAWKQQAQSISRIAAYGGGDYNLSGVDKAERIICGQVTADFFPMLGVQPFLGRTFAPEEDRPAGPKVAVLGHGIWRRRFGGDHGALGRTIRLNNETYTVIGVLPPAFLFPEPFQIWLPLALDDTAEQGRIRISLVHVVARLKPGVTMQQARAELETINERLSQRAASVMGRGPLRFNAPPAAGATPGGATPSPNSAPRSRSVPPPLDTARGSIGPREPSSGAGAVMTGPDNPPRAATEPFANTTRSDVPQSPQGRLVTRPLPGKDGQGDEDRKFFAAQGPEPRIPLFRTQGLIKLVGLHEHVVANVKLALLVLFGAVTFVLLIACANAANLLLARAAARQREIAVRAALGAGRLRLVRQLLTESALLSLLGGTLGLLLSLWCAGVLRSLGGLNLPHVQKIGIDGTVLAFTVIVSLATGLIFGLAPALQASSADLNDALKEGARGFGGGLRRHGLRGGLVVSEVSLALVLLISAGLMMRSFIRLRAVDAGFRPEGVLTLQINLSERQYGTRAASFFQTVLQRLQTLPGAQFAGLTDHLPMTDYSLMTTVSVEGRPPQGFGKEPPVSMAAVSPDYFKAMGIPLKQGRLFDDRDAEGSQHVVLVNEAFVRRYFSNVDPIGKRIKAGAARDDGLTIAGVVGDARQSVFEGDTPAEIYRPYLQGGSSRMTLVIRTAGNPMDLAGAARSLVENLDPDQPVFNVMSMEQRLAAIIAPRRLNAILFGSFASLALVLAVAGIYGVMSYAVVQRTHEIGVRMALGAQTGNVLGLVVRQGMTLTLMGVAIGLIAAFATTRYLSSLLYSVKATDPLTFLGVSLLLAGTALAACYFPARRAARVDPIKALRYE